MGKPAFDPSQPFETMDVKSPDAQPSQDPKPVFDPNKPFSTKPDQLADSKPYFPKFSFNEFKTKVDQQTSPEGMNHLAGAFFGPEALSGAVRGVAKIAKTIPEAAKPVIEYGLERIGVPVGLIKKMGGGLLKEGGEEASGLVGPARDVVPDAAADAYRSALQPKGSVARGEAGSAIESAVKKKIDPFKVRYSDKFDTRPADLAPKKAEAPAPPPAKTKIDPFRVRKNKDDK